MNKLYILLLYVLFNCNKTNSSTSQLIINREVELINLSNKKKESINNLIKKQIFYFNFTDDCNVCYEQQLNIINDLERKKIVIITTIDKIKNAQLYFESQKMRNQIYIVKNNSSLFNHININTPFFFYLKSDLSIIDYFVPNKEKPLKTKKYLK